MLRASAADLMFRSVSFSIHLKTILTKRADAINGPAGNIYVCQALFPFLEETIVCGAFFVTHCFWFFSLLGDRFSIISFDSLDAVLFSVSVQTETYRFSMLFQLSDKKCAFQVLVPRDVSMSKRNFVSPSICCRAQSRLFPAF